MLTSGTTGPPKRIDLSYDMLARSVMGPEPDRAPAPTELRRGVAIVNSPLVHIGGVFRVLQCVAEARPFVLLERFELNAWAEAVRKHRPRTVSLVPAALRTVLHSDVPRADLDSIRAVTCGTAPLSAEDADAFTEKYGIPVLTSYAATEFGGGVAGWTLADYQRYWRAKRGSVGRANPGAQLRVVADDGTALGPDQVGLLEVKPGTVGAIGGVDADHGYGAHRRGRLCLDRRARRPGDHPRRVQGDARRRADRAGEPPCGGRCGCGRAFRRTPRERRPVAMVELREPASADADELVDYLRKRLARYEIPTEIAIVDAIPRTPSGKADLSAIRRFFTTCRPQRPCPVIPPRSPRSCDTRPGSRGNHPLSGLRP